MPDRDISKYTPGHQSQKHIHRIVMSHCKKQRGHDHRKEVSLPFQRMQHDPAKHHLLHRRHQQTPQQRLSHNIAHSQRSYHIRHGNVPCAADRQHHAIQHSHRQNTYQNIAQQFCPRRFFVLFPAKMRQTSKAPHNKHKTGKRHQNNDQRASRLIPLDQAFPLQIHRFEKNRQQLRYHERQYLKYQKCDQHLSKTQQLSLHPLFPLFLYNFFHAFISVMDSFVFLFKLNASLIQKPLFCRFNAIKKLDCKTVSIQ